MTQALVDGAERCPHCRQVLPPSCAICGEWADLKAGIAGHRADHRASPGPDGTCGGCGKPTKVRHGIVGHVYDHEAVLA